MKDNSKFGSSQSLIDSVNEVLKGGQKKLDKNNNGKLDSEDFKKLRGEDHEVKPASNAQVGDKVHAGIGRKGGAGYSGVITKVDDTHAYIKVGETGKFGDRIVKAPHKLVTNYSRGRWRELVKKYSRISEVAENLPMRKESALGDLLGSEKGVRKISPRKDEYGNEIKNPARSLARKAMKSFAAKAMKLPMRKEEAEQNETHVAMPLKGHTYHTKTDAELRYIRKDAGQAARVQKGMSSEPKYLDQVNDAETVLHYRSKGGNRLTKQNEDAVTKAIKSMRVMKAKESTNY